MRATILNDARLFRIGVALSLALLLAIGLAKNNLVFRAGDFPALYGQLKILQSGDLARLYDFSRQREVQAAYFTNDAGTFLPGVYPPYYYQFLEPLGKLPARIAKLVWDSAALIAFLICIEIIARRNPFVRRNPIFVSSLLLLTPCFMAAVFGGQNTCFTLLFSLAAAVLLSRPTRSAHLLGGACLGLLFLKPQYGALALIVVLLSRSCAVAIGYLLMALYFWLIATAQFGSGWLLEWAVQVKEYAGTEYTLSLGQMTSCDGVLAWILIILKQPLPKILPFIGVLVGLIGWLGFSGRKLSRARAGETDFFYVPLSWLALLPIIAPHTIYYDLGLSLMALFAIGSFESDRSRAALLSAWLLLLLYGWSRTTWHMPLLFVFALIIGAIVFRFMHPATETSQREDKS